MNILILNLARLGDIYMTWPSIRAIRRNHPGSRISVLARKLYMEALEGLDEIDEVMEFPSEALLQGDLKESLILLSQFIQELRSLPIDWIINFSFSPLSSYFAHALQSSHTRVSGYTRHDDGYLSIPDDMSAYFYAQVGLERSNRFHLAEIFSTMVGSDLIDNDWRPPSYLNPIQSEERGEKKNILIHIGASILTKKMESSFLSFLINKIGGAYPDYSITLIGSQSEKKESFDILNSLHAENIISSYEGDVHPYFTGTHHTQIRTINKEKVINKVGETSLKEVFMLLEESVLLIGADSAPIHMASLTQTPCINISTGGIVNFWETGPRSTGSVVIKNISNKVSMIEAVLGSMDRIMKGLKHPLGVIHTIKGSPSFYSITSVESDFRWNLIKSIYLDEPFVPCEDPLFYEGMEHLSEVNHLILTHLHQIQQGLELEKMVHILETAEEIIMGVANMVPALSDFIRWYQTEKIRIPPGPQIEVLNRTIEIHKMFQKVISLYLIQDETGESESSRTV